MEYMPRIVLTGWYLLFVVSKATSVPGTTPNIKEIFIGRCWEYLEIKAKQFKMEPPLVNCDKLWTSFSGVWIGKDPKTIKKEDYRHFLQDVQQNGIPKILLWSGTDDIAHEYSRHVPDRVTLEESLVGYLANGIHWCGVVCSKCTGINYDSCPEKRENQAVVAFFEGASALFVRSLKDSGSVELMLSGSNPQKVAYRNTSSSELPNLPKTSDIHVILVHDVDKLPLERCNTGSLIELKAAMEKFKFAFHCVENPNHTDWFKKVVARWHQKRDVTHLLLYHNTDVLGLDIVCDVVRSNIHTTKYLCPIPMRFVQMRQNGPKC